ncbi:hypothetical protein [Streptomonospora wellingtoniae]|uniref:DUF3040 domain-containing protein n=1 Tax=Streptomonospora wellingtoniae TaxID=3075544 RepID=A0ABU2KS90_9ACTN|nr:hypothetical protein [Streptomonospora sp. DSM 45055]MDT0302115.1 hypothetical protein [Streptomonospora sp. DSM 45055]
MTEPPEDPIEERLRAILRAEADSVGSSPEALNAIRARTQRMSWTTALLNASWLRPSLAVGAAALIVGSVLLGTPQVRDQILPQSLTSPTGDTGSPPADGPGATDKDGITSPPSRPDPADRPGGGAEPTSQPVPPEDPEGSGAPYGTAEHCASGGAPSPAPQPSTSTGPGATARSTVQTECDSSDEPADPTEAPQPDDPGDGSTGDSTSPPDSDGDGDDGDTGGDSDTPGTSAPGDTTTGSGDVAVGVG